MITVKEIEDGKLIHAAVTDFSDSLGYCEHKIPFFLAGIKAPPSIETLEGTDAHEEEAEYEREHFTFEPITVEQLADKKRPVQFARESIYTRFHLPLSFGRRKVWVLLSGRSDKIFRIQETLVVQDDKFPSNLEKYSERIEPYPDQILQALTYLNSSFTKNGSFDPEDWFEIPHKDKAWIIQILDKYNENKPVKIFKGIQDRYAINFLKANVRRFARLVLGFEEREHHNKPDKCKPCRYFDQCDFRLV